MYIYSIYKSIAYASNLINVGAVLNYIKYQQFKLSNELNSFDLTPSFNPLLSPPLPGQLFCYLNLCIDELPYRSTAKAVATVAVAVAVIAVVTRCQGRHQVCEFSLGSWDLGGFSHKNYAHINA